MSGYGMGVTMLPGNPGIAPIPITSGLMYVPPTIGIGPVKPSPIITTKPQPGILAITPGGIAPTKPGTVLPGVTNLKLIPSAPVPIPKLGPVMPFSTPTGVVPIHATVPPTVQTGEVPHAPYGGNVGPMTPAQFAAWNTMAQENPMGAGAPGDAYGGTATGPDIGVEPGGVTTMPTPGEPTATGYTADSASSFLTRPAFDGVPWWAVIAAVAGGALLLKGRR
jgi:hypothetical protein